MIDIILTIIGSIVLAFIICGLINCIYFWFDWWDKIKITIRLPKPKKYLVKVDPIYELAEWSDYDSDLKIVKWSLSYDSKYFIQFLLLIIPYPVELLFWKYHEENSHFLCKKEDVGDVVGTLEENYNRLHDAWLIEHNERIAIYTAKENKIDELNKEFKANYE
jgi:hypothetical protein